MIRVPFGVHKLFLHGAVCTYLYVGKGHLELLLLVNYSNIKTFIANIIWNMEINVGAAMSMFLPKSVVISYWQLFIGQMERHGTCLIRNNLGFLWISHPYLEDPADFKVQSSRVGVSEDSFKTARCTVTIILHDNYYCRRSDRHVDQEVGFRCIDVETRDRLEEALMIQYIHRADSRLNAQMTGQDSFVQSTVQYGVQYIQRRIQKRRKKLKGFRYLNKKKNHYYNHNHLPSTLWTHIKIYGHAKMAIAISIAIPMSVTISPPNLNWTDQPHHQ